MHIFHSGALDGELIPRSQRLDPAAMHVSCFQAGMLLARLGRPEAHNCIAGLEQYSYAYEEARGQVTEMKLAATSAQAGDFDFNHMASLVPRITPAAVESNAMNVDQLDVGIGTRGGSQLCECTPSLRKGWSHVITV